MTGDAIIVQTVAGNLGGESAVILPIDIDRPGLITRGSICISAQSNATRRDFFLDLGVKRENGIWRAARILSMIPSSRVARTRFSVAYDFPDPRRYLSSDMMVYPCL